MPGRGSMNLERNGHPFWRGASARLEANPTGSTSLASRIRRFPVKLRRQTERVRHCIHDAANSGERRKRSQSLGRVGSGLNSPGEALATTGHWHD